MQQLQGEALEAEIASFSMALNSAFKTSVIYISVHRDVVQGLVNQNVDLKGTNMALEERIGELENELKYVRSEIDAQIKGLQL